MNDAVAAYDALLASGLSPDHIAIAGDSAGGGLAVAWRYAFAISGQHPPAALALFSPWVDPTLVNVQGDWRDPFLRRSWLVRGAKAYAGHDTGHPLVSPIRGDLRGLPPMLIHATSTEILLRDIERFAGLASAAGVAVRYRRLDRSWHVAHLHAGLMAAATAAVAEAGTLLNDTTTRLGPEAAITEAANS